ncbi:MAG TPA: TonB-dependent receptor [Polyangia bacterium]|jgi:hypothetical protein
MNRIRGAIILGLLTFAVGNSAWAQETTGRVIGSVTDSDTGAPLPGVTVIVQGPQGEDATITDAKGQYLFTALAVGTYVVRYYVANTSTQVERPGIIVSAEKTVRVNAKIASTAQANAQQTYVITGKAPTIDVGSPRVGTTFDQDFTLNLALDPNYGAVISKAPGAFVDGSGNVSIGGATGLENMYIVNGMNVTGMRYGNLEAGQPSISGGTNLPTEFLTQIGVNAGGYQAEFGGAMGGVINTVLKSGTNEFHGSVFGSWAPYWLSASPTTVTTLGSSIAGVQKRDFDDRLGFEVGGPLIKDKLFFWAGMAPQITDTHVLRYTYALQDNGMGMPKVDAAGNAVTTFLPNDTQRANETHRTYSYAATLDYIPKTDHKLELTIFGTPSFNNDVRGGLNGGSPFDALYPGPTGNGPTTYAQESLTRTNTDVSAHWTSKLFDRHWQIDALAGLHSEYFYDRSPSSALNSLNQLQYAGGGPSANLGTQENLPGCNVNAADNFAPCPVNPFYLRGGFGEITKSTGNRWTADLKSMHLFEAGGHHELKYGWHLELQTLDISRSYSGPGPGQHALDWFNPDGTLNSQSFFRLKPGQSPADEGVLFPNSDLVDPAKGLYQDALNASVKSLTDAFFLQETFSPQGLRNLSVNAGVRYEFQTLYDMNGASFIDTRNLAPRVGAVYDPFNDGRSKISVGYGQFYEAIPLDMAARYFGGENFVQRQEIPLSSCAPTTTQASFVGAGEWHNCSLGPPDPVADGSYSKTNNGTGLHQSHIEGQYQNEVVATLERELMEDMTVRVDYMHRWLGRVVEDGYGDDNVVDVLGNPGNVPAQAITDAQKQFDTTSAMAAANPNDSKLAAEAANAKILLNTVKAFASEPKPERTYDSLSLTLNKRFSRNWFVRGAYTYSRLVGNYEGLYQSEQNYVAPNGTNAYDTQDLVVNARGYLPNDHPHQGKIDGYYSHPVGPGKLTFGLSFLARSGMPRNDMSNLIPGANYQIVFLLPRGSAGRTPTTTQLDSHISYAQKIQKGVTLEAFVDLFNIFDERATQMTDDNYTYDAVAPIQNGTANDLKFAKNVSGQPVAKNANFGRPISYQAPFYSRLGLRLMF